MEESYKKQELESLKREYKWGRSFLRLYVLATVTSAGIAAYGLAKNDGYFLRLGGALTFFNSIGVSFVAFGRKKQKKKIRALERELTDEGGQVL